MLKPTNRRRAHIRTRYHCNRIQRSGGRG